MAFVAALVRKLWLAVAAAYRHLLKDIGFREMLLIVGAALLGVGAGLIYPAAGFIAPAVVLLYVAIRGVK